MPNIIDKTYFQKANELNIPQSVSVIVANPALETPNSESYLTNLCVRIEKSILVNALGLQTYNTLQLALADIDNPLYASYKKLVQGDEYDNKIWNGLDYDYSLIAYKIFEEFVTERNEQLSGVGVVKTDAEKSNLRTPSYKIATANQKFFIQYQNGYLIEPIIFDNFIDWFGNNNDLEVSLHQYLMDKADDFTDFKIENFRVYCESEVKNTFGI